MAKNKLNKNSMDTVPDKSLPPNPWGLYGMHGNVWEWCQDAWDGSYNRINKDGSAKESLNKNAARMLRGGSWDSPARFCRSAYHISIQPNGHYKYDTGFRCIIAQLRDKYDSAQWGSAVDIDRYGMWKEFTVEGKDGQPITQRMRWIEPGTFMMGSPETEAGRYPDERQHKITIEEGFWMADTTVTQALWEAVIIDNPSRFKGLDLPVEGINWRDAQVFIKAINKILPGLKLSLPSEAQWEYACRAGTTTVFSFGDNLTREQANQKGGYIPNPTQNISADKTSTEGEEENQNEESFVAYSMG